jgi:hypothetical protein
MEIHIHNKFEITCGNVRKTFFNTVLPGLNDKFLAGDDYTCYIVFGTGRHGSLAGVTALALPAGVKKTFLCGFNKDTGKGQIYIKKSIELLPDEFCGVTITEAALTACPDGSDIINYAALENGEGITKEQGKSLTICATIFLTISGSRTASLCGGENPLFDLIFGIKKVAGCDIRAVFSNGIFKWDGMPRQNCRGESTGALAEVSGGKLNLTACKSAAHDCREIVIAIDGVPALSFTAGEEDTLSLSENAEFIRGEALIESPGVLEVNGVNFSGLSPDYEYEIIPDSACDAVKNPLEFILKPSDKFFYSPGGKYFAFYGGDCLYAYDTSGGKFRKMNIYYVTFAYEDIKNVMLDNSGNMYVNIKSAPYMCVFRNNGGDLYSCSLARQYPSQIVYTALSDMNGLRNMYYIVYSGGVNTYYCYAAQIINGVYSETLIKSAQADRHFYCPFSDQEIIYNSANNTFTAYPGGFAVAENVLRGLKECTEAQIWGNLIFVYNGSKLTVYEAQSGQTKNVYESGVRRVYYGGGRLIKLYANNKISGAAVCRDGGIYAFDIDERINGEIGDAKVFGGGVFLCAAARFSDCYYLPFSSDRVKIKCPAFAGELSAYAQVSLRKRSYKGAKNIFCKIKLQD